MKRFLSILLVAMLVVSSFAVVGFAAGSGSIAGGSATANYGAESVKVSVTVKGEFANFELYVKPEAPLTIAGFSNVGAGNTSTGKVVWATDENVTEHTFTVTLNLNGAAIGTYKIDIQNLFVSDRNLEDLEISVSDGSVKVVCDHVWGDWTQTKAPTCAEKGKETRTCTICGATETRDVDMTDHTWGEWKNVKEATCTEEGEKERVCSVCGEKQTEVIAKTEHNWGEWNVVKEATCTKEGLKERFCSICGEKQSETIAKVAHKWGDWKVVKEATCTEDGLKERFCSVCGEKQSEVIPASDGHKWGEWTESKAPTCTEAGEMTRTCSACGATETKAIDALGHKYDDSKWIADETHHWHVCTVCGAKCEHNGEHVKSNYYEVVKEPTANETGLEVLLCEICGYEMDSRDIPATGGDGPVDPVPGTGDPTGMLMIGGLSILVLLLAAALYIFKRKAAAK